MFHSKIITAIAAATFFFSTAIAAPAHGIPNLQLVAESRRGSAISLPDNQLAGKFTATDASVAFGVQRPARANTHSKRHHTSDPDVIQACAEIDGAQAELAALISALGAATSPADIASTLDQIKTLLSQVKANVAVALDGSGDIDGSGDGSGDVDTTDLINKLVALLQGLPDALTAILPNTDGTVQAALTGVLCALGSLVQAISTVNPDASTQLCTLLSGLHGLLSMLGVDNVTALTHLSL